MDKQFERLVDHLIKSAISEITDKLPEIIKETVYKQLEQVYKGQKEISEEFSRFRDELKDFDKRMSDMQILVDTIDSRTTQMKIAQDKQPKSMEKHVTDAVNNAVESAIPEAIETVVKPSRQKLVIPKNIKKKRFWFWPRKERD